MKTSNPLGWRALRLSLLFSVALTRLSTTTKAQTWSDANGNHRWSKRQNWVGDNTPANDGTADLLFLSSPFNTSDIDNAWDIHSLTFGNPTTAFTISGQDLTIQAGITNNSSSLQTFANTLVLGQSQTWRAESGGLTFNGNLINGGHSLTLAGSRDFTFAGSISGLGGLDMEGAGTLTLSGSNNFSGGLVAHTGTVAIASAASARVGTLSFNNATLLSLSNGLVLTNALLLSGNVTFGGSSDFTLAGNVVFTANQAMNVINTRPVTISGSISQLGGSWSLTKNGAGELDLTGVNTFSGLAVVNGGTLGVAGSGALGAVSSVRVNSGGTLQLGGTDPMDRVNNAAGFFLSGGRLTGNNHTETFGVLTLENNSTISLLAGGSAAVLTFASATRSGGTLTIDGWTGTAGSFGTDDRIFLPGGATSAFLQNVDFAGFPTGAQLLPTGELVPVPEPGTLALISGAIAVLSLLRRRQWVPAAARWRSRNFRARPNKEWTSNGLAR